MTPIDYRCDDCGAAFEVGVGSLLSDDYNPGCPDCSSEAVRTDWDAVSRRFGDVDTPARDLDVERLPSTRLRPVGRHAGSTA